MIEENVKDLRVIDYYLTDKERDDWNKQNILYNTLWFYLKKASVKGNPDLEYCDSAVLSYMRLPFFSDWKIVYHSNVGKVLGKKGKTINADLMTGWWNPVKYFMKWNSRKSIDQSLLDTIPKGKNEIRNWLITDNNKKESEASAMLNFLDVVYTDGNIIPAPVNWRGRGPDSWDYKLSKIKMETELRAEKIKMETELSVVNTWMDYISEYFDNRFDLFIEENRLEMYIQNDDVISYWKDEDKDIIWTEATDGQWEDFFKSATKLIKERHNKLNELN